MRSRSLLPALVAPAVVPVVVLSAVALAPRLHAQTPPADTRPATTAATAAPVVPPSPNVQVVQQLSDGFARIADAVLPAVVSLRVEARTQGPQFGPGGPFPGFPFPFPFGPQGGGGEPELQRGTGSGVIVGADGIIVTNRHVVDGAERISVHLRDGRTLPGSVVGDDPATDLAVVRVEAHGLPTARWGDSDAARVGEWVLAIGAPFGLEATVTQGVLSAKGRAGLGQNAIEDYLQTDAAINPGNSGGPLVNTRGEVLGINTMILGRGASIGFAVPSRIARSASEQIVASGRVARGWIGVGVQDLDNDVADAMGRAPDSGAIVSQVDPRGPAGRAGLRVGDVIASVGTVPVRHSNDVVREVTSHPPGDRLDLAVQRNGRTEHVAVVTAPRPESMNGRGVRNGADEEPPPAPSTDALGGLSLAPLASARAHALGLRNGATIADVAPGSPADAAGLRPGDIVVQADQQEVRTPGDVEQAARDGRALLLVRRGRAQIFVVLRSR